MFSKNIYYIYVENKDTSWCLVDYQILILNRFLFYFIYNIYIQYLTEVSTPLTFL